MAEHPILFSGPMVRAIIEGRKTQTRRIVKWPEFTNPDRDWPALVRDRGLAYYVDGRPTRFMLCPYGVPGARLWVRETFCSESQRTVHYRADGWQYEDDPDSGWRPSIHMPRWASRITLEVTEVRVQRLNEISECDAEAEGVKLHPEPSATTPYRSAFIRLWEQINGKRAPWASNPWVWAVTFRRLP